MEQFARLEREKEDTERGKDEEEKEEIAEWDMGQGVLGGRTEYVCLKTKSELLAKL